MRSLARLTLAATAAILLAGAGLAAQDSAQALLERGAYGEALQRVRSDRAAGNNDPTAAYLGGLAALKMDQPQQAREEFAQLSNGENEAWRAIGQSAIAVIDGAMDEAANEGTRAKDINGELGFAFYQLGQAQLRRNDWDAAAQALDRACELMPEFAYAFYDAGIAHQRAKRFNQMAERFQRFMQLAPNAPERKMAQLALNALRG